MRASGPLLSHHSRDNDTWHTEPQILDLTHQILVVQYCLVAALAWISYDIVISVSRELTLVWKRWRVHKGRHNRRLYLLARYLPVVNLIIHLCVLQRDDLTEKVSSIPSTYQRAQLTFSQFCIGYQYGTAVISTLLISIPDLMMLIRINSLYDWSIIPMMLTVTVLFVNTVIPLLLGIFASSSFQFHPYLPSTLPGCFRGHSNQNPLFALGIWIPAIFGQTIYFALMVNTLFHVMKGLDQNGKASVDGWIQVRRLVPTMMIYIRHGIWYYLVGVAAKIFCIVMIASTSGPLRSIGLIWLVTIYPMLVIRIYLDMVEFLHVRKPKRRSTTRGLQAKRRKEQQCRWSCGRANETGVEDDSDVQVDGFDVHASRWSDEEEGHIKFSRASTVPRRTEPITFAERSSWSLDGEVGGMQEGWSGR